MNNRGEMFVFLLVCVFAFLLTSCGNMPAGFLPGQSWYMDQNARNAKRIKGYFTLLGVTADRVDAGDSVRNEVSGLAPLYFWQNGYCLVTDNARADYAADVRLREREYISGWRTRRSISLEVRIWDLKEHSQAVTGIEHTLPLAAARVTAAGNKSFSSSETAGRMLALAVKRAVRRLASAKRGR